MSLSLPMGMEVIVWARPEPDLILLFGEGVYDGTQIVNGNAWPVVKLTDGRDIVVHYTGVELGRKEAVVNVCKAFQGDIVEWSLDEYLRGRKPERSQRVAAQLAAGQQMPEPKTVTDRLLYMKREIELEEQKKLLGQKMIDTANAVIAAKRAEMAKIKNDVLAELAKITDVETPTVLPEPAKEPAAIAVVVAGSVPPSQVPAPDFDEAAQQAALED